MIALLLACILLTAPSYWEEDGCKLFYEDDKITVIFPSGKTASAVAKAGYWTNIDPIKEEITQVPIEDLVK